MNNIYGNMLKPPPQRSYTRQTGAASGLGQAQPNSCPSGYRFDQTQGKCVAVNRPVTGFWNQVAQGVTQSPQLQQRAAQPGSTATAKPTFPQQAIPKMNQLSPYAALIAQAIDLNPPLAQVSQPYPQQIPAQNSAMANQLNPNNERLRMLLMGGR